ncbi:aldehyde dehydrogenase family protein [Ochrobactrum sp. Q0168]|uniref:Aldehyde dehydrogenase family protein n=1 Tax=Ochrobactrum soli TaxID=2448455 RepID=A0A849KYS0_9HYPH|nr:aldehyde dehydrogenase family protein [[Ochrobactrum] soli]MBJ6135185.1 aldehyde dehydrogenase family protein [Ochrobactrum sp. Q0168]NNU63216.1 aldehyde dehydrogenase family protein [[Ochrobactrum] soli]
MNALSNDLNLLGAESRAFLRQQHGLRIGGRTVAASGGKTIPMVDPSSGDTVGYVPEATAEDVNAAVGAARHALENGPWSRMRPHERALAMSRLADLIEHNSRELSELETINSGRLIANTRLFDVEFSAHTLRYMSGWATKIEGRTVDISAPYMPQGEFFAFTQREPIGTVAGITPWNVPLCQAVWKIAPALAAGCTIVLKPAEPTPLTALRLADLALEAGIPEGVLNVVTGSGADTGAALVKHPGVDKISFTGSTATGKLIASHAAATFKKYNLELGGKSPVVIMADADLEKAIPGAAWAIFGNHGQNCCAGSRLYVHEAVFDKVLEGVAEIARSIRLGPGLDPQSQMGPLVNRAQQERVLSYIETGKREGASVLIGGEAVDHAGSYVKPTVLVNTNQHMRVVQEEIFGPVLVASKFTDEAEALKLANDSEYGLGASIWTRDISRVHRFIRGFKAGNIWVNVHNVLDTALPFGGTKNSGVGHDLGEQSVLDHTRIKAAVVSL